VSRFTRAAATMHTLSLAAMEEASRFGVRDADIDHLLLALTLDPDVGGQVLRGLGVSLTAARAAVGSQHAEQLDLVGISSGGNEGTRIVFHETSGYEWTDRAIAVLKDASRGDRRGDSAAVLRALVDERSGLIEAILRRLDVDPDVLRTRLEDAQRVDVTVPTPNGEGSLSGTRSVFVPASIEDVWALLSSPARIPEWDQGIASIAESGDDAAEWEARTASASADGRPIRVAEEFRRQLVRLVHCDEQTDIRWRFLHPDAPRSNARSVGFALEHAAGGIQLRTTLTWETEHRRRGLVRSSVRRLLTPLHRFVLFIQLTQLESGITRVFR
jgi:hypothetical protein